MSRRMDGVGRVVGLWGAMKQLAHEADVGDSQSQGLNAGETLLVGKGRDLVGKINIMNSSGG